MSECRFGGLEIIWASGDCAKKKKKKNDSKSLVISRCFIMKGEEGGLHFSSGVNFYFYF